MERSDCKYMAVEWNKYVGCPFKHLGLDPKKGIDCLNLIIHIYKEELGIEIPYTSRDWCNTVSDYWYDATFERPFEKGGTKEYGWKKVTDPEEFDVITMTLGSSLITNHAAIYIGKGKILHSFQNHKSHIAVYGNYFKQYTMGIHRWIGMPN